MCDLERGSRELHSGQVLKSDIFILARQFSSVEIASHADPTAWSDRNRIEPKNYSHQAVAIMLNGYSKNGAGVGKKSSWDHMPLFKHLSYVALALDQVQKNPKAPLIVLDSIRMTVLFAFCRVVGTDKG
jgi:hypothetical protein